MAIDMVPVNSAAIKAVGHDPRTNTVHVEFHSGGTHLFGPFTQQEYERFRDAESIGKHFHHHVRAKAIK
jgi:KTSC domain